MRPLLVVAGSPLLARPARGHGTMYEPPSRNGRGVHLWQGTGCVGGGCLWYSEGTSIGCPVALGRCENGTLPGAGPGHLLPGVGRPKCKKAEGLAEPTIGTSEADRHLRTYNVDGKTVCIACPNPFGDWTQYNPWRKPGSAPVADPCGLASGTHVGSSQSKLCESNGAGVPPGARLGDRGSELPKLLEQTVWIAGSEAEVAWAITANHGGGYSYRLCPAGSAITEECFQKMPLDFVGDTQWIQFGHGMDVANRTEIPANQVSVGTVPAGSQWRRNPIPGCGDFGGGGGMDPSQPPCTTSQFPPPIPGLFGFGCSNCVDSADCMRPFPVGRCFDSGIVDKVHVPDVPPGDYVLGFRLDMEQTSQIWQQCADVTIKAAGTPSTPFAPLSQCDPCCGAGVCANCTGCINDKTGDCAYCWKPVGPMTTKVTYPGYEPHEITCLGHEDAPTWYPGDKIVPFWSPGCPKCWATKDACTPRERR